MTKQDNARDWQKDMEMLQKKPKFTIDEVNHIIYNVAPYWLQQAKAERERAEKLKETIKWAIDQAPWGDAENSLEKIVVKLIQTLRLLYPESEGTK